MVLRLRGSFIVRAQSCALPSSPEPDDVFIRKPYDPDMVVSRINDLLTHH
jgi:hypothetical protein